MPISIPNVTGWPQAPQGAENPANAFDPLASLRREKEMMEIAMFADRMKTSALQRNIDRIKLADMERESGINREMLEAGKSLLTGTPSTRNVLAPGIEGPQEARPNALGSLTGTEAPIAGVRQAPNMIDTTYGPVDVATAKRYPQVFGPAAMQAQAQKRDMMISRQKEQEKQFESNIAKAIETSDPSVAARMVNFYSQYSDNPYIKSRATELSQSFKDLGGGNFTEKRYFSQDELNKIRESTPSPEGKQLVPFGEGFYTRAREKGKTTWKQEHATDDELADFKTDQMNPNRSAWADRIVTERGKMRLAGKDYSPVGVTADGGTVSSKGGINYYWNPKMGNAAPVPWNQAIHGKILPKTESYVERIQKGEEFIGTPQERTGDVEQIRKGTLDPGKVATGGGMGGYGLAYSRQIRQDVRNAQEKEGLPDFNYALAGQNFKYLENANTLRAVGLSRAVLPRVFAMEDKIDKISNKFGIPVLDQGWNKIRKEVLGDVGLTDYESLRNDIIQEVNTALSGTSVSSDSRLQLELERLKSSATPGQLKTAIRNLKSALQARIDSGAMIPNPWEVVRGEITQKEWFKAMDEGRDPIDIRGNKISIFGLPKSMQETPTPVEQRKPGETFQDYLRRTRKQ